MGGAQRTEPSADCLVCREISGSVELPGGLVLEESLVVAFHVPPLGAPTVYRGHLLVTPRRHLADFAALRPAQAAAVGVAISRCSAALKALGAEQVYLATIGDRVHHLHVHLLPRWPGTPPEVPWHAVDEWDGAPMLTPAEIALTVERLRELQLQARAAEAAN